MKLSLASALFVGSAVVAAIPLDGAQIFKRGAESPDGTCGNVEDGHNKGYKCPTGWTKCCSKWGWCGDSEEHCGTGCQAEFGNCKQVIAIPDKVTRKPGGPKTCPTGKPGKPGHSGKPSGGPKPSGTAKPSDKPSGSVKPSGSGSPSETGKPSATGKPSGSASSGPSGSASATGSGSPSGAASSSALPSSTISVSPVGTPNASPSATAPETVSTPASTASSSSVPLPSGQALPYGAWVNHCVNPGQIALTFDDGPHTNTFRLVETLAKAGAKATFFINGNNWMGDISGDATYSKLLQDMAAAGHQIGSHTFAHENLDELATAGNTAAVKATMEKVDNWLLGVLGKRPTYMRPPYFACDSAQCQAVMKEMSYHMFNADLDTKDYEHNTEALIGESVKVFNDAVNAADPSKDSFLVLMHEVHATTVDILVPAVLETIQKKGFKAVTLGECLNDAPANWYKS